MQGSRLQRLSVLIVDDNQNMRELIRAILQAFGIVNIYDGRDGEHGITKIRDFSIDLVITDWVMEPQDGLDLIKWVRTSPDCPDNFLPIIMVTGHTEKARIVEARDAGINEFVAKPVSAKSLYRRLVSVIEHPRQFVRTKTYFGPDRRRKVQPFEGPNRRTNAAGADAT